MSSRIVKVFGIGDTRALAESVCAKKGWQLSLLKEEIFPDGEMKICSDENVNHCDVIVIHSAGGDSRRSVNDRLCELFFFLSSLRDSGASEITAMIPYLPYARADQRKHHHDPLINRYVSEMLESSGVDRIISMDVHNIAAFENAFRIPVINLEASSLFCRHLLPGLSKTQPLAVLSPDIGGIKRAEKFRKQLETESGLKIESAFLEKYRTSTGLQGHKLIGDVKDKRIIILDDMISTGGTILKALKACKEAASGEISVMATHGIFSGSIDDILEFQNLREVVVTDSHPALNDLSPHPKLHILSCASLFAECI